MLTKAVLKKMWPTAAATKINAIAKVAPAVLSEFDIDDPLVVAHLMAQISHENGGGTIIRENMNYSAPRMLEIFGVGHHSAKVTPAEAERIQHKPKEIAERVYGLGNPKKAKELGNTKVGDGYRFRGGGDLQLTGGDSYRRVGDLIGVDLYNKPEQLDDPAISFRCAAAEFVKLNCVKPALDDDVEMVTKRVNGGYNGLAERKVWLRKWKAALAEIPTPAEPPPAPVPAPMPPPNEPRGGESDLPTPPLKSKTLWAILVGFFGSIGTALKQALTEHPSIYLIILLVTVGLLIVFVGRGRLKQLIQENLG